LTGRLASGDGAQDQDHGKKKGRLRVEQKKL